MPTFDASLATRGITADTTTFTLTGAGRAFRANFTDLVGGVNGTSTYFQTNVTNGRTRLFLKPNGTETICEVIMSNNSNAVNSSWLRMGIQSNANYFDCGAYGTGTVQNLQFLVGGVLAFQAAPTTNQVTMPGVNSNTGTATAVHVDASGNLVKLASSLRYKIDVRDYEPDEQTLLAVRPVIYKLRARDEQGNYTDKAVNNIEYAGMIAEEMDALGLKEFVNYDSEGRPDGVAYERYAAAQQVLLRKQAARIDSIEERLAALEGAE